MRNFERIFDFDLTKLTPDELLSAINGLRSTRMQEIAEHNAKRAARAKAGTTAKAPKAPKEPKIKPTKRPKTLTTEEIIALCGELGLENTDELIAKLQPKSKPKSKSKTPLV